MPVTRFERADEVEYGVEGSLDRRTVSYIAEGTDPSSPDTLDDEILSHALTNAPSDWGGMPRTDISLQQVLPFIYRVDCQYSFTSPRALTTASQTAEVSFSYGTQSQRVKYSLETEHKFPATAEDFSNAIGVRGSGSDQEIEGAESLVAVGRRSLTYAVDQAMLTQAYEETIEDLVGKLNDDTFMGRPRGEVKFLGANGSTAVLSGTGRLAKTNARITFDFEVKKSVTYGPGATIAGISIPDETVFKPHSIVWPHYAKKKGVNGVSQVVKGVYVERVLEYGDFSQLGIPQT